VASIITGIGHGSGQRFVFGMGKDIQGRSKKVSNRTGQRNGKESTRCSFWQTIMVGALIGLIVGLLSGCGAVTSYKTLGTELVESPSMVPLFYYQKEW